MAGTEFDRGVRPGPHTIAFSLFRDRFTELNAVYWSSVPAFAHLQATMARHSDAELLPSVVGHTSDDSRRYCWTLGVAREQQKLSERWMRMSTVVGMAGALEVYLGRVCRLAVLSDPIGSPGWPKLLDGAVLLKAGRPWQYSSDVFVTGTWERRLTEYRTAFGSVSPRVEGAASELQKLQNLRNGVAHRMGRDARPADSLQERMSDAEPTGVSQKRLKAWFGMVMEVASEVDSHLSEQFIGAFEYIELFHHWHRNPADVARRFGVPVASHRLVPGHMHALTGGKWPWTVEYLNSRYVRGLESYYKALPRRF